MHSTVRVCKRDLDGYQVGCQLDNPILDIQLYDIEFPNGEVTLLTSNKIAQAIYAQCNIDRNEYSLLRVLLTYRRITRLSNQKSVQND